MQMGVERDCDKVHMYIKQEMCTLCSAGTPSPLTRLRGEKVKVHEAFLSDVAHTAEGQLIR